MLKIRQQQFDHFQQRAEIQFARQLQHALAEKYPHLFSRFPDEIQNKIVNNMISRAQRWGISWKSSLVTFTELMIAVAPNFDEQSEVKHLLENDVEQVNQVMQTITNRVPESVWSKAAAATDDLPFFVPADHINASLIDQTDYAIPLVLWDKIDDIDTHQYALNGCRYAGQLGLNHINDASLTLVVWRILYGPGFNDPKVYPWVNDLMDVQRSPRELVSMIKLRVALDHGRMV